MGTFGFGFWDLFVLGARTLHKEGVMICWLGHWDAVWVPALMSCLFVLWLRSELRTFH